MNARIRAKLDTIKNAPPPDPTLKHEPEPLEPEPPAQLHRLNGPHNPDKLRVGKGLRRQVPGGVIYAKIGGKEYSTKTTDVLEAVAWRAAKINELDKTGKISKITIDERLETLTRTVELLVADHRKLAAENKKRDERLDQIIESLARLSQAPDERP